MKKLLASVFLLFLLSCEPDTSPHQTPPSSDVDTTAAMVEEVQTMDCTPAGEVLEGNQHWFADKGLLVCISADSSTYEEDFGMSHRILQVWDTRQCEQIHQQILPINNSPDFPYYLSENLRDTAAAVACCQGFEYIFCFDLNAKRPIPRLEPVWSSERASVDAQSGSPMGLQLLGEVLLGYARDFGAFAFDLSDRQAPSPLLPLAEYQIPEVEDYSSLFCIPSKGNTYEFVLPEVDDEGQVKFKKLSTKPFSSRPALPANARNNRFLVLSDEDGGRLAVDMKKQAMVDLPAKVMKRDVQDILDWLKQQ
ncbi:MAG: hypothetical protein AAF990_14790 [Bacteroidota bacterium]